MKSLEAIFAADQLMALGLVFFDDAVERSNELVEFGLAFLSRFDLGGLHHRYAVAAWTQELSLTKLFLLVFAAEAQTFPALFLRMQLPTATESVCNSKPQKLH
jgi:hypothetical protein